MDNRQAHVTLGQATNLAAVYWADHASAMEAEDWIESVIGTARIIYPIVLGTHKTLEEELTKRARADAASARARAAESVVVPPDAPYRGQEVENVTAPPLEATDEVFSPAEDGSFLFDPDGSTWQVNENVVCPKCGKYAQRWDSKWLQRNPNAKGNRPPAFRCASQKWDKSVRRPGSKYPGDWVSQAVPPCDWVDWRPHEDYPA